MTAQVVTFVTNNDSNSVANFASGTFSTDGGAAAGVIVALGFTPRYIKVVNITDLLVDEWFDGFAGIIGSQLYATLHTVGSTGDITLVEGDTAGTYTDMIVPLGPENTDMSSALVALTAVTQVADPGLQDAGNSVGGLHTNAQGGFVGNGFYLDAGIAISSKKFAWYAMG